MVVPSSVITKPVVDLLVVEHPSQSLSTYTLRSGVADAGIFHCWSYDVLVLFGTLLVP